MKSNKEVVEAWAQGKEAHNRTMSTDGKDLYSYRLLIGSTMVGGTKLIYPYTAKDGHFVSNTTSKHVSIAMRYREAIGLID